MLRNIYKSPISQFLKIIGDRTHLIREDNYAFLFEKHPILKAIVSIGPCYYMIGDAYNLQFLHVSENCKQVIGYTPHEIKDAAWQFQFQVVYPPDIEHCMQMIQTAWSFLKDLPGQDKLGYIANFYYRAVKKDGAVIKVQHQVINLETDVDGKELLVCIVITDISHLHLSDQVKLALVNSFDNTCLTATAQQPSFLKSAPILSKRETEILNLISGGMSSKQIAEKLFLSYYTVRTHRKNILEKLGKKNTAEVISYTLSNGLI